PSYTHPRELHSFPTRRSSDLEQQYDTLAQTTGTIPKSAAIDIVSTRFKIREVLPYKDFVTAQLQMLIDAHKIEKHDLWAARTVADRKSTRLNSSHVKISYAVF